MNNEIVTYSVLKKYVTGNCKSTFISLRHWNNYEMVWDYLYNKYVQWIIANHVPLCCDHDLCSYRRLADSVWKNIVCDIFSNIGIQCRFVIKRGHIFTIPFRVKLIHLIPLPKCKYLGFYEKLRAPVTLWSLYLFKTPVSYFLTGVQYTRIVTRGFIFPHLLLSRPSKIISHLKHTFGTRFVILIVKIQ